MLYLIIAVGVIALLTIILVVQDRRHGRARSGNVPVNRDQHMLNNRLTMRGSGRRMPGGR